MERSDLHKWQPIWTADLFELAGGWHSPGRMRRPRRRLCATTGMHREIAIPRMQYSVLRRSPSNCRVLRYFS